MSPSAPPIETARLSLRPVAETWLTALISGPGMFALLTGLRVADGGCGTPEELCGSLARVRRAPARELRWWAPVLFIERAASLVVGMGGYKGSPRAGAIEIGYSIAPGHRGRGLATEAAAALAAAAFKQPGVDRVLARTLPAPGPSPRVLEKCGFARAGEVLDPNEGPLWCWELPRAVTTCAASPTTPPR